MNKKVRSRISFTVVLSMLLSVFMPLAMIQKVEAATLLQQYPVMQTTFGWDGDKDAPIAYVDGSIYVRDGKKVTVSFGIAADAQNIEWYNDAGYLPCMVSEFEKQGCTVKIKNFSDKVNIGGNDYEIAYSRVSVLNNGSEAVILDPGIAMTNTTAQAICLSPEASNVVEPGQTVNHDYATAVDRFGNTYSWPADNDVMLAGGWDVHYDHMRSYWDTKLSSVMQINELPDTKLIEAYKAGYIYTHIVKDGIDLNVGENGYDKQYDHDAIGILSTLISQGDFTNAKEHLLNLRLTDTVNTASKINFPDFYWKYSWPWALYLMKTGDKAFVTENFARIKEYTQKIETDRTGPDGIMKQTYAIDSTGYWTVDNWSALMGLLSYKYICSQLGETTEEQWASDLYDSLLQATNNKLSQTVSTYNLNYIPVAMDQSNDMNRCVKPEDANWASMFLFGRWAWDGYLFNGKQEGISLDWIDRTYDYGFGRLKNLLPAHDFGGYPHGPFSSSYNAGYASTGLRGEKYRSEGIKAYQFMINNTMSAPYSWYEGVGFLNEYSPWDKSYATGGGGSSPHMWGQSVSTKVLMDSLIAEKIDGKVIIGRGVPDEWLVSGKAIDIGNYPLSNNKRMGYRVESAGTSVTLTLSGDAPAGDILFNLPFFRNNIKAVSAGTYDDANGLVTLPSGTGSVTVELKQAASPAIQKPTLSSVNVEGNTAKLAWSSVEGATGYKVKYGQTLGLYTQEVDVGNQTSLDLDISGLDVNQKYYFVVTAYDSDEESEYSNFLSVNTELPQQIEGGNISGSAIVQNDIMDLNLTTPGAIDWIHMSTVANNVAVIDRKAGVEEKIKYSKRGAAAPGTFSDSKYRCAWTDGTPIAASSSVVNNVVVPTTRYGVLFAGIGNGWQIEVPADTTERELKLYTSVWKSNAKLEAFLSDNSGILYSDINENWDGTTGKIYTIRYKAASDGQKLIVRDVVQNTGRGNVTLTAATLWEPVTISKASVSLKQGEQQALTAVVNIPGLEDKSVVFSTSNDKVVSVADQAYNAETGVTTVTASAIGVGTAKITATSKDGQSAIATVSVGQITDPGTGSSSGSNSSPAVSGPEITKQEDGSAKIEINPASSSGGNTAITSVSQATIDKALSLASEIEGLKSIVLKVPVQEGVDKYTQEFPKSVLQSEQAGVKFVMNTQIAEVVISDTMFNTMDTGTSETVGIEIGTADKTTLSSKTSKLIGDRPVIELRAKVGDTVVKWHNPKAPVKVSLDYTPSAEELKNPEHIVVYYIDGTGKVVTVPNGRYNAATGKVTFTTTHFSTYAVGYVKKSFNDMDKYSWAIKPVEVLASKGIVEGISETSFNPGKSITRAEFMGWLVKTLGLEADFENNFSDISTTSKYYQEIAIAKKLNITSGTGNNRFSPDRTISRQDMMVLTIKALKIAEKKLSTGTATDIKSYTDASKVATYAKEGVATMVKEGLIKGSGNKLSPTASMTRAEVATVLYKIYSKY